MGQRFNLVRYFAITSLVVLLLVGAAVLYMEREQGNLLRSVQYNTSGTFRQVQNDFSTKAEQAAVRDMLRINESNHETLTKLMANVLWERELGPYMAQVSSVPEPGCKGVASSELRLTCYREFGQKLRKLPGFAALDRKVYAVMQNSTVFKVKIYDLRGVTVYSSEQMQVGEDKSENAGWKGAATETKAVSELTHRDRFSAFEGVVADRDLISSYLPMFTPGGGKLAGVFEIYSDVTPFLKKIKSTTDEFRTTARTNAQQLHAQDAVDSAALNKSGWVQLILVSSILAGLYVVLLRLVMRAQKQIDQQQRDAEEFRKHQAKADKTNSMAQLVEGLINQLKVPMSSLKSGLDDLRSLVKDCPTQDRIWVRNALGRVHANEETLTQSINLINGLRTFGRQNQGLVTQVDLNALVASVVHVVRVVTPPKIEIAEAYSRLPAIECNFAQFSQAVLNLLLNAVQAIEDCGRIKVITTIENGEVRVSIKDNGCGISSSMLPKIFEPYFSTKDITPDNVNGLGLSTSKDIVEQHGGRILVHSIVGKGSAFAICLPIYRKRLA